MEKIVGQSLSFEAVRLIINTAYKLLILTYFTRIQMYEKNNKEHVSQLIYMQLCPK
jgi:hypothetical protein